MNTRETNEIWKQIKGFPRYQISNMGRVKSFTSPKYPDGRIMKQRKDKNGYMFLSLSEGNERGDNKAHTKQVHRLVANAFLKVPPELRYLGKKNLQVDHRIPVSMGGLPTADNLRWTTVKQNANNEHTVKNREKAVLKRKQQVYVYDEELVQVSAFTSTADAARILNKSQGNIASSCTGALPRYLGRIWSYEVLTDMQQRKDLEEKMHYQFVRNRKSTKEAVMRWYPKGKAEGKLWYQNHPKEMRERSKKWYIAHREEIIEKKRIQREQKKQQGQT